MKYVGLITEYNPFHLGHKYHLEASKKLTNADGAIVIMSGNFVQRGTPSFVDKFTKARVALNNGADVIMELPCCFACSGAEYFAYAAVTLLDRLGIVDSICFGAEDDDIELLTNIAEILVAEPAPFKERLKSCLEQGMSFPAARQQALADTAKNGQTLAKLLSSPNNILGIEYIKALIRRNSPIKPYAIKRTQAGYHDTDSSLRFYSASAMRELSDSVEFTGSLYEIDSFYKEGYGKTYPVTEDDMSMLLGAALHRHIADNTLQDIFGMNKPLSDKIANSIDLYTGFSSFVRLLKTKETGYTTVQRVLLHCILDTKKEHMETYMKHHIADFVRILGFRKDASHILKEIEEKSDLALLTKLTESRRVLGALPEHNQTLLSHWLSADTLYRLTTACLYGQPASNEYRTKMIKL